MSKMAENITDLIGNTPLLKLSNYSKKYASCAKIIAKLECFNPGGSVKDRAGYAMIKDAEDKGILKEGSVIIEPTSGNMGVGLALAAASKGYKIILTMPDTMSLERRKLLMALGAEVVLTPGSQGMKGAVEKACELSKKISCSFMPQQFDNPVNPEIHRKTTAFEIWRDTDGKVDIFVACAGTGGTVTGVAEGLKSKNDIKIIAVEPYGSPVLSGGKAGTHKIQGIGAGFIPKIFKRELIDEIFKVKDEEAYETSRRLSRTEGLLAGISSGAAVFAAGEISKRPENKDKVIVALLPDTGERYLSTDLFK